MSESVTIKVKTERLVEVSSSVSGQIRKTRNAFEAIERMVQASGGYWDGKGHDAFLNAYRKKLSVIDESLVRFQENVTDLQQIAGIYEETERDLTDNTASLPNDLII